jgi:hypothetical protein
MGNPWMDAEELRWLQSLEMLAVREWGLGRMGCGNGDRVE